MKLEGLWFEVKTPNYMEDINENKSELFDTGIPFKYDVVKSGKVKTDIMGIKTSQIEKVISVENDLRFKIGDKVRLKGYPFLDEREDFNIAEIDYKLDPKHEKIVRLNKALYHRYAKKVLYLE